MKQENKPTLAKRFLAPGILNYFDNKLLKKFPDIWSARTHLVFYYGLLVYIGLFILSLVVPDDARTNSPVYYWSTSSGLLTSIGFIVWLIYLFRFNVFKRFGKLAAGDRLRTYLAYFFSTLFLIGIIFVPFVSEKIKADCAFTDDEIVNDVNNMNRYIGQLESSKFLFQIRSDTIAVVPTRDDAENKNNEIRRNSSYGSSRLEEFSYVCADDLPSTLLQTDSFRMIQNNEYVRVNFTSLRFLSSSNAEDYGNLKELSTLQLYYIVYRNPKTITDQVAQLRSHDLYEKYYHVKNTYSSNYDDQVNPDYVTENDIRRKYDLETMGNAIYHIYDRKHRFRNDDIEIDITISCYFALILSLLVFAFRHCTIRTFFFSLLAGVVLSILTGLMVSIFRLEFFGFLVLLLIYYCIFTIMSATIFLSKKRSLFKGIALNFSLWLTYFVPVIIVKAYYEWLRKFYNYYTDRDYYQYFAKQNFHLMIAEFLGVGILLAMIAFVYSRWYRTWYSQPEE
jgi:hypothetical protein